MADDPTTSRTHRLRARAAIAAWCPLLYLLTLLAIWAALRALLGSADDLADVFGFLYFGLFVFGIGGHIVYGLVVRALIPAPRRRLRVFILTVGTPFSTFMVSVATNAQTPVVLTPFVAASALGYWAAAPRRVTADVAPPQFVEATTEAG